MSESFLKQHDTAAWARTREAILPCIHEVARNGQIVDAGLGALQG